MASVFPAPADINKAPVLQAVSIEAALMLPTTLCTILAFQFLEQNHFYASAESKPGQLLWLKVYLGGKREREREKCFRAKSVHCKLTVGAQTFVPAQLRDPFITAWWTSNWECFYLLWLLTKPWQWRKRGSSLLFFKSFPSDEEMPANSQDMGCCRNWKCQWRRQFQKPREFLKQKLLK